MNLYNGDNNNYIKWKFHKYDKNDDKLYYIYSVQHNKYLYYNTALVKLVLIDKIDNDNTKYGKFYISFKLDSSNIEYIEGFKIINDKN